MPLPLSRRQLLGASLSTLALPPGSCIASLADPVSAPAPPVAGFDFPPLSHYITLELHRAPGEDNTRPPDDLKILGCKTVVRPDERHWVNEWQIEVSGPDLLQALLPAVDAWRQARPERYYFVGHIEDLFEADSLPELEDLMKMIFERKPEPERLKVLIGTHWRDYRSASSV